ncbi:hypothetical protein BJX99DRAFT_253268 [Aspergillus californicus]
MSTGSKELAPPTLKEFWDNAIIHFKERTGQRLDGVTTSVDDLQKALTAHYDSRRDSENVSKAKGVGFQMIHCFQLLGGIAAQGASMAFGPAGLCFNAISFLLDIPKKVHELHGDIDAIFEEVGQALAQFRIYQRMEENTHVDDALRTCIFDVMTCFVDLCADCMVIHKEGRWKSFKRSAKKILLDDGSVQGNLNKFKKLTQYQLNIQATLTLEVALETNQYASFIKVTTIEIDATTKVIQSDVSGLVEGERKRNLDDTRKSYLTTVKEKLGLKDEHIATVTDAREKMWKSSVKDTGKWLNNLDEYKQWLDRDSTADPFLVLTGDPGTGKSYLVSAIAKEVKSSNSAIKAEQNLVGYYSFSVAGKNDGDRQRPETAFKSICVQLAEQSHVYAKHAEHSCKEPGKDEKYFRDANCQDLWTTLGIGAPAKNTTHYILLDSVSESTLQPTELDRLVKAIQQEPRVVGSSDDGKSHRVRILISVEPSMLKKSKLSDNAPSIDVTKHNHDDIQVFITEKLDEAHLFQGADEDSQRRRKMTEERLMKRSNNCYITVQQDLSKIKEIIDSGGTEDELNRVLQDSSSDPTDLVRSELETLEAMLKPREIDEINELLIWAVAGSGTFELEELSAALFLRFNTVSLQPLMEKITGRYSKLFSLAYGDEYMTLKDYIEDCVVIERDGPRQSPDDPRITATISITNGNVKSVQRFFWDLNHYSFFKEFAFQPGSDLPNTGTRKIQLYKVDAHLEIVKRAFSFFLMPSKDDRAKPLGRYLMGYINDHLSALHGVTGPDELLVSDKEYIGSHIYDMFNEGDLVERNWEFRHWVSWYQNDEEMETFWKWLDDPVAVGRLGFRDKRWLAEMKEGENRNQALLTPIMTVVARNWLRESKWEASDAYAWINGFLTLGTKARDEENDEEDAESDEEEEANDGEANEGESDKGETDKEETNEGEINEGETNEEEADEGETDKTAEPDGEGESSEGDSEEESEEDEDGTEAADESTASSIEDVIKAEQWCKQALNISEVDHTWCTRLALTYISIGEIGAAVKQYEQAATILKAQDPIQKDLIRDVYQALGKYSTDQEAALGYLKQAYEQDEANVDTLYALLKRYISIGKEDDARSIMQTALTEKATGTGSTLIIEMLKLAVANSDQHDMLAVIKALSSLILLSPDQWTVFQDEVEAAIEHARTADNKKELAIFLLQLGTAIHHLRKDFPGELDKVEGYWRESLTICSAAQEGTEEFTGTQAFRRLSMRYFEEAMHAEGAALEQAAGKLQDLSKDTTLLPGANYRLADLYALTGQPDKARDLLRSEVVTAFNILNDDDAGNDWQGFVALRGLLGHAGDYENAKKAAFLVPRQTFNAEVLEAVLADEEPSLAAARVQLAEFYQTNCPDDSIEYINHQEIVKEAERLLAGAESDSEEAAMYNKTCAILKQFSQLCPGDFTCNNCSRAWNYENSFHVCKYCDTMDLCNMCYNDLQSDKTSKILLCGKAHDWWILESWTMTSYVRAWKQLVPVQGEDGSETFISASKWLGNLCDEWGLSKSDWNFE